MEALVTWGVREATSKSGNGDDGFAMWPEFNWSYDTRGGQLTVSEVRVWVGSPFSGALA